MTHLIFALAALLAQSPGGAAPSATQSGVITGQILAANGTPAANMRVAAIAVDDVASKVEALVAVSSIDSAGMYRLENLPPGRYVIMAGPIATPTYYPGVNARSSATVVTVTGAKALEGIGFKMKVHSVSGRIAQDDVSAPVALSQVSLQSRSNPPLTLTTNPAPDGSFEIRNVPPGSYDLVLGPFPAGVVTVENDVSGLKLTMVPNVAGHIVVEGNGPLPRVVVFEYQKGGCSFNTLCAVSVSGVVQTDGSFKLALPQAWGMIRMMSPPDGYSIASLTLNGVDILQDFRAKPFPKASEVALTLSRR